MPDAAPSAAEGVFTETPAAPASTETPAAATTTETPPATPAAPASTGLSKEDVEKLLQGAVTGAVKAAQPPPAQPNFTQEDFDRTFNVFKPNKELLNAIRAGDEDAALAAVSNMVMGIVKQATTMSAFQLQQLKDEIQAQVTPAISFAQRESERVMKQDFYKEHKDLEQYDPLVMKVVADLQAQGFKPTDQKTAFAKVSEETRKLLASIPGLKVPATNGTGGSPSTSSSQMSTLSSGGQGGAGGSPTAATAKSKSPGLAVFD